MANLTALPSGNHMPGVRLASEKKLGILHFTSGIDFGWHGDIRKRYTDFIVHEVRKDGTVVYLTDMGMEPVPQEQRPVRGRQPEGQPKSQPKEEAPIPEKPEPAAGPPPPPPIDTEALVALVGPGVATQMQDAYAVIVGGGPPPPSFTIAVCEDRSKRGHYHQEIRRIFSGRFETRADGESGAIVAMPAAGSGRPRNHGAHGAHGASAHGPGQRGRDNRSRNAGPLAQDRGKYLHFTMYKENKDTIEAIGFLARLLKIKSSSFGFSGTKDRRAATTQRVSVSHVGNRDIAWINARSTSVKVGDFARSKNPIQLGQHGGNDFVIVVKGVELTRAAGCSLSQRLRMAETCVQAALDHVYQHGFINYFGLQRFGTHAIGTQEVGQKILSEDFEGACDAIMHVEPALAAALQRDSSSASGGATSAAAAAAGSPELDTIYHRDEVSRARAILLFRSSGDVRAALDILPRRFSAESTIIQHLGRTPSARRDFCGALCRINRGLRNLYIHAYQSLVWNWATSLRWARHGDRVIAGDLILVESEANPSRHRQGHDMSEDLNQEEEQFYQEARVLSAEEAASGQYTIFDIVLPVPGYDVLYPDNDIGEFYTAFMGRSENGSLDPYRMRRPQKEFSLSGHYRKVMARFSAVPQFFVRPYRDDAEQMHPTDLNDLLAARKRSSQTAAAAVSSSSPSSPSSPSPPHVADPDDPAPSRRRRLSPGQQLQDGGAPVEAERVNNAWIEKTAVGGSSKRVKIDPQDERPERSGEQGLAVPPPPPVAASSGDTLPTAEDVAQVFNDGSSPHAGSPHSGGSLMALDVKTAFEASPVVPLAVRQPSPPAAATVRPGSQLPPASHLMKNLFKEPPPLGEANSTAGASFGSDAAPPPAADAADTSRCPQGAINRTAAWRRSAPGFAEADDMEIAVVLNFRLSSSNYATMCLREMMSSAAAGSGGGGRSTHAGLGGPDVTVTPV